MSVVPRVLIPCLLVATALSGCILEGGSPQGPMDPTLDATGADTNATAGNVTTGTLRVLTLAPDMSRIADARAEADGKSAFSDGDGIALIDGVTPGNHTIIVSKDGFRAAKSGVRVTAGETTDVQVKLFPGADDGTQAEGNKTYTWEDDFVGVFECSLTYLIITGDCLLVADFLLNETAGLPVSPGDNTEDANAFSFPLDAGWESVVVEMFWDAPLAPMGEKMQLALEPSVFSGEGHAPKYARVTGGSPLAFTVHKDVAHETASVSADGEEPDMPNPAGGEVVTARAYVLGELHNPGGTSFLGIGAAYGQKFEIYVTVFYGAPAPEGFSRMPA